MKYPECHHKDILDFLVIGGNVMCATPQANAAPSVSCMASLHADCVSSGRVGALAKTDFSAVAPNLANQARISVWKFRPQ